jgi:hypothetical protein
MCKRYIDDEKWQWAEMLAMDMQIPIVRLVDTAGGSVKLLEQAGNMGGSNNCFKHSRYKRSVFDMMLTIFMYLYH